ncbi:hypothetical protein [Streptomyces sp. NPDC002676]
MTRLRSIRALLTGVATLAASAGLALSKLTVPSTTGASGTVTVYVHGWYGQGAVYADDLSLT